jgi:U3 small nucleolar RNA-associated protein 13
VGAVSAVAFAPRGGGFVATGSADRLLRVWPLRSLDLEATKPAKLRAGAAVAAHDKDINAVAVSPNDALLCSASLDRTAKVWELPSLVLK